MHRRKNSHSQRGAVAIMVALSLIVLLGFASLAIDMGRFRVVSGELQNASDSGSLAAAWELDATDTGLTAAKSRGIEFAEKHSADNDPLTDVTDGDIELGRWNFADKQFTVGGDTEKINAVRVTTYRGTEKGTTMIPWLGGVTGFSGGNEKRFATAVGLGPGCGNAFPVAVPECVIKDSDGNLKCDENTELILSNDIIDNAGITSLSEDQSANVNTIRDLIENYDSTGKCNSTVDDNIKVQNGNPRKPVGEEIRESILDKDGDGVMTPVIVCMPVVDPGVPCSQIKFNQTHAVSGYVAFELREVVLPNDPGGDKTFIKGVCIKDTKQCGGPAGGEWYGVKGKPRLVE